jgi:hypothetical protein
VRKLPSSRVDRNESRCSQLGSAWLFKPGPARLDSSTLAQIEYSRSTRCSFAPKHRLRFFTKSPLAPPKRPALRRAGMVQTAPHPASLPRNDHLRPQLAGGKVAHTVSATGSTSRPPGPVTRSTASSTARSTGNASRVSAPRMTPSMPNSTMLLHVDRRRRPSRRWHH